MKKPALFYILANVFNIWLHRRQLDAYIFSALKLFQYRVWTGMYEEN